MTRSHRHLHVAVGAIVNSRNEVLIAKRPNHLHMGGLWEFPGGKLEAGESVERAVHRELQEEIGIQITLASPLIKIQYRYPDRTVLLDVWRVESFAGQPSGRENQRIAWVAVSDLNQYSFPEANLPIISALRLPGHYAILEDGQGNPVAIESAFERILEKDVSLVQFRGKHLKESQYRDLAKRLSRRARQSGIEFVLNADPSLVPETDAAGVHLNSPRLMKIESRPLGAEYWVSASCHNLKELQQAQKIGADFAVLGPVCQTLTHPGGKPLGWDRFAELVQQVSIPVFALGGLALDDLWKVREKGGQGVAGIRSFID